MCVCTTSALDFVSAKIPTPHGEISVAWKRCGGGGLTLRVSVPEGTVAVVVMPDVSMREVGFGEHVIECNAPSVEARQERQCDRE